MKTAAFDSMAADYDPLFVETKLGRQLREIVWNRLKENITADRYILELNCGTGEDAVWLAKQGCRVVATDVSQGMLAAASRKVEHFNLRNKVDLHFLDLANPSLEMEDVRFDGAFSNFGGLNCVQNLEPIAFYLAEHIQKGGRVMLVIMGRWCLWEIFWHLLHGQGRTAFRRFSRDGVDVKLKADTLRVWYPAVQDVHRQLEKSFVIKKLTGLGVFLPPTYLEEFISKHPFLWKLLTRLEYLLAGSFPFKYFADHLIFEYERI